MRLPSDEIAEFIEVMMYSPWPQTRASSTSISPSLPPQLCSATATAVPAEPAVGARVGSRQARPRAQGRVDGKDAHVRRKDHARIHRRWARWRVCLRPSSCKGTRDASLTLHLSTPEAVRPSHLPPEGLCHMAWALGAMGYVPQKPWLRSFAGQVGAESRPPPCPTRCSAHGPPCPLLA